jgi:diguanylate cyclase (GGDEF)-like protein
VVIFNDISDLCAAEKALSYRATHDALTRLPNRARFLSALGEAMADVTKSHVLCVIDLDHFKSVNDQGGHAAGDMVLRKVAEAISRICPQQHVVARLGGDEFATLMVDCDEKQAEFLCNRIIREIRNTVFDYEGRVFHVGASIGATLLDGSHSNMGAALHEADMACYASKRRGRNSFTFFGPETGAWGGTSSMKNTA